MRSEKKNAITRRDFLQASALLTTSAAFTDLEWMASQTASPLPSYTTEKDWMYKPMRWANLTLVENDPGNCDLQFWLDYFRRTHADAALLSAGGCVAYYPTKIPLHHRSSSLGDMDPFGELVAGCRKLNMVVTARVDPHAVHQDVYKAHPDWDRRRRGRPPA